MFSLTAQVPSTLVARSDMEVTAVSGTIVAQLEEDEVRCMVESGRTVRELKRVLAAQVGCSRFRQRLLTDEIGELQDDMPLCPLPRVQLVILSFCAPHEIVEEELLRACEENRVCDIERLLQKPQDPNRKGRNSNNALNAPIHGTALYGHLEAVRLLLEAGAHKDAATVCW